MLILKNHWEKGIGNTFVFVWPYNNFNLNTQKHIYELKKIDHNNNYNIDTRAKQFMHQQIVDNYVITFILTITFTTVTFFYVELECAVQWS